MCTCSSEVICQVPPVYQVTLLCVYFNGFYNLLNTWYLLLLLEICKIRMLSMVPDLMRLVHVRKYVFKRNDILYLVFSNNRAVTQRTISRCYKDLGVLNWKFLQQCCWSAQSHQFVSSVPYSVCYICTNARQRQTPTDDALNNYNSKIEMECNNQTAATKNKCDWLNSEIFSGAAVCDLARVCLHNRTALGLYIW